MSTPKGDWKEVVIHPPVTINALIDALEDEIKKLKSRAARWKLSAKMWRGHGKCTFKCDAVYIEASRVVDWIEKLADAAEKRAKDRSFSSLADANAADAANYRASVKLLKKALEEMTK